MIIYARVLFSAIIQQVFMHVNMHPVDCSFDEGLCGWRDLYNFSSGNSMLGQYETNGYLKLGSIYWSENTTLVESLAVQDASIQCLRFHYMTKRSSYNEHYYSGALSVVLVYNNSEHLLIQLREGNIDNKWQKVLLNIKNMPKHGTFHIRLIASIEKYDVMNIDNIELLDGVCRMDCDFEEDVCGWMIRHFNRSTYTNGIGHYLLAKGKNVNASMTSTSIYLENFQCLTFLYQMRENYTNKIEVLVQDKVGLITRETWTRSTDMGHTWHNAILETDVTNTSVITIIIQVLTGEYRMSSIGLDNISISQDSCLDCTFSEGFCNWEGGSLWKIKKNAPEYAYTLCMDHRNESSLISKSDISPGPKCLLLLYLIEHGNITFIMVKSTGGLVLSNKSEIVRNVWTEVHTSINLASKSRIAVSFVHIDGCHGQYAIMNISLKKGLCPNEELPSVQVTDKSPRKMRVDQISSRAAVGGIIGIVIGCLSMTVAVLLLAVYIYRRRRLPTTESMVPRNNTVSNKSYEGAMRTYNIAQNASNSSTYKKQRINENVLYIAQADYATVEKKKPHENEPQHCPAQGIANRYPLAESLLDTDRITVSNYGVSHLLKQNSDDSDENNPYDIMHDTRSSLPESAYDHINKLSDDNYDSTIPGTKRTFDETYSHTTLDSTNNRTICIGDSTYNTTISSPGMDDSNPIYELTDNVVFERAYQINQTPAKDVHV